MGLSASGDWTRRGQRPWPLSLLQRFYDVTAGTILVDGIDIRDVTLADLRQSFAYVEQEPIIFAGTIAENIRFGKPDAAMDEVR